jgi:hypothetical protein
MAEEKKSVKKGVKPQQIITIYDFIQKYHRFALCLNDVEVIEMKKLYPNIGEHGFNIKYIDTVYDSRFSNIWSVSFRGLGCDVCFNTNTDLKLPYENLFDWIMDYLKGDWKPSNEQYESMSKRFQIG